MRKLFKKIRTMFRSGPHEPIHEPVTHRLNPHPILPQGMMESIAPAYEEALAKEKRELKSQNPLPKSEP